MRRLRAALLSALLVGALTGCVTASANRGWDLPSFALVELLGS